MEKRAVLQAIQHWATTEPQRVAVWDRGVETTFGVFWQRVQSTAAALRALGCSNIPTISSFVCTCGLRILWVIFILPLHRELWFLYLVWPISWVAVALCHAVTLAIVKPRVFKKMRAQQ